MQRTERGTSLIEIIFAVIVIGVVVSAVVAAINTSVNGSTAHRELVTADTAMRSYAEAAKSAVRTSCPSSGTWSPSYTPPTGYTVSSLAGQSCPSVTSTSTVTIQVTSPNGTSKSMQIVVRSP